MSVNKEGTSVSTASLPESTKLLSRPLFCPTALREAQPSGGEHRLSAALPPGQTCCLTPNADASLSSRKMEKLST